MPFFCVIIFLYKAKVFKLQVLSGKYRGKSLSWPKSARPTSMRAKEALFNTLFSMSLTDIGFVWDAFSASGSIGIEFLSRGWAKSILFSDIDKKAVEIIEKNLNGMSFENASYEVVCNSALNLVKKGGAADLIFIDAPYSKLNLVENLLSDLLKVNYNPLIIVEIESSIPLPRIIFDNFKIIKDKSYGRARFLFIRKSI